MRMQIPAAGALTPLAIMLLVAPPAAAQGFEGVVTWQMNEKNAGMVQTYKGSMVRTEMSGEAGRTGVMLMDNSTGKWTMLMPDQKMYMTMDMKTMGERMGGQKERAQHKPPKITDTGRTETIAGRSCTVYTATDEERGSETMELCAAKGMGFFMMGSGGPMQARGPWAEVSGFAANPEYAKIFKDGFFPLRVSKLENGKARTVMLATRIEPKSVDAAQFQVPAGYTEMKMPGMGQNQ